ncbi:TetR/AcrR family transcriptional regulator [Microbacterium elymi]|uniref:TetR/AcrR family transcriptional regulator n=1 Tax=Microbacterium elymi TaxID=2909587 RepID=A0ABY5NJX0_9MICO|nr:TetR/AcrR family transcriptional regulator [Microbacterium elymi]UUT35462.1 TetR/AcrR family transcriptional regulator [Microbacterium elymi]
MSRPPHARESVLDAFAQILMDDGERAATMDATARAAGVSKGGLLYHFATKDALEAALIERLRVLVDQDVEEISNAPEGVVAAYVRTSMMEGTALDRALLGVSRLAQGGSPAAGTALHEIRERWADAVRPHVRDETALRLVLLVSDGLYFNNLLDATASGPLADSSELDALAALVRDVTAPGD